MRWLECFTCLESAFNRHIDLIYLALVEQWYQSVIRPDPRTSFVRTKYNFMPLSLMLSYP